MLGALFFFILPSGLNAGWLGLASCLGILQVAISHGTSKKCSLPDFSCPVVLIQIVFACSSHGCLGTQEFQGLGAAGY